MHKHLYSRFLQANPDWLHFAAHSHYLWPDATCDAHVQYWEDSARLVDRKWEYIFGSVLPSVQKSVATRLNTDSPEQIVFAPNTHELVSRLLTCFSRRGKVRILSTDSEFHSFDRQAKRLEETQWAEVDWVATQPFETFENRLCEKLQNNHYDLLYLSTIFFNSGIGVSSLDEIVQQAKSSCQAIVLDAYHSFCALPINLQPIQDDVFLVAGGYKYAQSGEGVCFMHVPKDTEWKPVNTGWYAGFADLESGPKTEVAFSRDGQRFAGATFDPSGLYRMKAVFEMMDRNNLSQETVHQYVQRLQQEFLELVSRQESAILNLDQLVDSPGWNRGHFFAFEMNSETQAAEYGQRLKERRIMVDVRTNRVRFGFGLYQDSDDLQQLAERIFH